MPDRGTVLVTGAAGLIGSAVIWALNQRGDDRILAVDRLDRSEKWRNLAPLRFDDYIDADALGDQIERGLLDDVRAVVHLGACSSTTETDGRVSRREQLQLHETARRVDAGARHPLRLCVVGRHLRRARRPAVATGCDITALRPLNMYGYSKQLFDLHASTRGYLDRIAGLKYFNVFGPNEDHKGDMRSVVNKAFEQILETGRVRCSRATARSSRRRAAAGLPLRQGRGRHDAAPRRARPAPTDSSTSARVRSHTWRELVGAVFGATRTPGRDRVRRHAAASCAPSISTRPRRRSIGCAKRLQPAHRRRSPRRCATTSRNTSSRIVISATSALITPSRPSKQRPRH